MNSANSKLWLFFILTFTYCNQTNKGAEEKKVAFEYASRRLKNMADSLYDVNNYSLTIKYLDSIISIDSSSGENYFMRAYCYDQVFRHTDLQQTISDYTKAIQLGYKKEKSYFGLGLCYAGINDSIAMQYFKKSLDIDPNFYQSAIQIDAAEKRLQWEKMRRGQPK